MIVFINLYLLFKLMKLKLFLNTLILFKCIFYGVIYSKKL